MTGQDKLDERLLRYLLEEMETSEREEVEAWMEENDQNRNYFRDFQKTHLELLWSVQARETRTDFNTFRRKLRKPLSVKLWYRVAAVVVLMVSIGGWFVWSESSKNEWLTRNEMIQPGKVQAKLYLSSGAAVEIGGEARDLKEQDGTSIKVSETGKLSYEKERANASAKAVMNRVEVPRGGEFSLVLEDGTQVWLNAESELRYPIHFMGKERVVYLKGEAYFNVVKNSDAAFLVQVDEFTVKVYGTEFNVNAYEADRVETVLTQGSVSMRCGDEEVMLKPNQKGAYFKSDGAMRVEDVNVLSYVAWKNGDFIFKDESLESIMNKLARWYDLDVFYQNKELKEIRLSGNLKRYKDVQDLFNAFEKISEARIKVDGRTVVVSK
ncbi:FecR family protein [Odoribacter sp. AF15-53]|mgnify:CR=1 FL=1|uniref:FecR family protein n=1 Tax=Odoribacter sp. AF15-53 TaxID=2292236 RepID=UPI000E49CEC3|nr:FecR family protein [Odoribacter sp. AF15-53]RHR80898.1 FecR family protein [Odoribacter sp. AF15-53]